MYKKLNTANGLFQSTPSVGRATTSSRGEKMYGLTISIHALRGEGDDSLNNDVAALNISIHALRGEGDSSNSRKPLTKILFQSTPSVGRATLL